MGGKRPRTHILLFGVSVPKLGCEESSLRTTVEDSASDSFLCVWDSFLGGLGCYVTTKHNKIYVITVKTISTVSCCCLTLPLQTTQSSTETSSDEEWEVSWQKRHPTPESNHRRGRGKLLQKRIYKHVLVYMEEKPYPKHIIT